MPPRTRRAKRGRRKYRIMVRAPNVLGGMELFPILATEPEQVIGRTVEVLLADLTGDFRYQFVKVKLKIVSVKDNVADTIYSGHEYFREYERSLILRGTSYVKAIRDVTTRDNYKYRIRVGVFTTKRITSSRKKAIRRYVFKILDEWSKRTDNESFIKDMLFGNIDEEIKKVSKKVYPIREGTGIMKVKLIEAPIKIEIKT